MKALFALMVSLTTQSACLAEAAQQGVQYQEQVDTRVIIVTDTDGTRYVIDTKNGIQYIIDKSGRREERKL